MEEIGIEETIEAVEGVIALACVIVTELKDGYQASDVVEVVKKVQNDPIFLKALQGISKTPREIKDMDWRESLEVVSAVGASVPAMIRAVLS